jgi:ElaB/YqjD/DUF883 family membrane-anchored ribosome-binding protein
MEKTITFKMTETQAKEFEKLLDATLEILNRMEKESPERDARIDKMRAEFQEKLAEVRKTSEQTSQRLAEWGMQLEK